MLTERRRADLVQRIENLFSARVETARAAGKGLLRSFPSDAPLKAGLSQLLSPDPGFS